MTDSETCQLCGSPLAYSVCPKCPGAFQAALLAGGRWKPARPQEALETILKQRKKISVSDLITLTAPLGIFDDVGKLAFYTSQAAKFSAGTVSVPTEKDLRTEEGPRARPQAAKTAEVKAQAKTTPEAPLRDVARMRDESRKVTSSTSTRPPATKPAEVKPKVAADVPLGVDFAKRRYESKTVPSSPSAPPRAATPAEVNAKIAADALFAYALDKGLYKSTNVLPAPSVQSPPTKSSAASAMTGDDVPLGKDFWKTLYGVSPTLVFFDPSAGNAPESARPASAPAKQQSPVTRPAPAPLPKAPSPNVKDRGAPAPTPIDVEALNYAFLVSRNQAIGPPPAASPLTAEELTRQLAAALAPIVDRLDRLEKLPREQRVEKTSFLLRSAESITLNVISSFLYEMFSKGGR